MIRFLLACTLCVFPLELRAQPVTVISGEHADFSRLVVMLDTAVDWDFGRVAGGYELRTDARTVQFEGPRIYDFIPKSRISSVSFPGPGRMFLAVTCTCSGDVFELRQGQLAIDIKDGLPDEFSRFEGQFSPLAEGASWQRGQIVPQAGVGPIPGAVAETDGFNDLIALLKQTLAATAAPPTVTPTAKLQSATPLQSPGQTSADPAASAGSEMPETQGQQQVELPAAGPGASVPAMPVLTQTAPMIGAVSAEPEVAEIAAASTPTSNSTNPILSAWPRDWEQVLANLHPPETERVELVQSALLKQLSRAAAQGVVQMDIPEIMVISTGNTAAGSDNVDSSTRESSQEIMDLEVPAPIDHMRVETVIDRDAEPTQSNRAYTDLGNACLPDSLMQVADWGPAGVGFAPLSDLRAKMLQEFDDPDAQSIGELARRYIYLGFGAEAINLIDIFPEQIESADILLQIADIVDDGSTSRPGRLVSQLTCTTPAAMWAVLAQTKIPGGVGVDTNIVLRTFSGLPAHLRSNLGPGLANRFLDANDAEIAASIRDITERAAAQRDAGFEMLQANIAEFDGDTRGALRSLKRVAASGSPSAPLALAQLLETKLANGDPISQNTAVLADAMATENRGTEIGARLTLAAIRGYAASGQVDVTFERIAASLQSGLITAGQAGILANEAHMRSAENSPNVDFLRVLYLHPLVTDDAIQQQRDVRRAVATRLIDLGLPRKANITFGRDPTGLDNADRHILARAALDLGDYDRADEILRDAEDPISVRMLARSNEMRRDYASAVAQFGALNMSEKHQSAAWRAGDWPLVAQIGSGPRAQLAELLITGENSTEASDGADPATGSDLGGESAPIAAGKSLLAQSQAIRELVDNLLIPAQQ